MCGICGMFGNPDRAAVARMAAAMVHRGPDDDGFYEDGHVVLGFRRLAIIDVAGGHQPLSGEDGSVQVVANGEIYNHRELRAWLEKRGHHFRTRSDAEVLPHLYEEMGPSLVNELNGIFAFAIWDARNRRLCLARDPHGVKPLYYAERDGTLLFASEIKALLASGLIPRSLNPEAVAQYLIYQAVPPPLSMVEGVGQVPPGSILIHDGTARRVRSYWTPPVQQDETVDDLEEATALVRDGLADAVRRQMMSERPLGVFLSGGVDSSALVAMAAPLAHGRLKTFSVGFVGPDETILTEWPWARLVAERYGTDHHEFVLTEDLFRGRLDAVLVAMDQPTADGMNSYYVSLAAAEHVTVALSGTGGDELFLGYGRDARLVRQHAQARRLRPLPTGYVLRIGRLLAEVPEEWLWQPVLGMRESVRIYADLASELLSPRGIGMFDAAGRDRVLARDFVAAAGPFLPGARFLEADVPADANRVGDWLSRLEQRAYLSFVLLRDIDAMSMSQSLEIRVPFLDRDYAATLSRIPWEWKLRDGAGKWILKRAMRDILPAEVLERPKMGFGLPYNVWMRRSLEPIVRDTLSDARVRRRGILDPSETAGLVGAFYAGDDSVWQRVWTLFVLEAWTALVLEGRHG